MRRSLAALLLAASLTSPLLLSGCSTPRKKPAAEPAEPVVAPEPPPQCFKGCALSEDGLCQTYANVADWSDVQRELVDCDPRCCEAGWEEAKAESLGGADADGDGVFDDADGCPDEAEDFDGFQDDDGCPEPDNDGDSINDADDVCPLDAEDIDGFQDQDGCPDL